MGYIILYSDPNRQVRLTLSNNFKHFTYIDYDSKEAKRINIQDLLYFIKQNGSEIDCNKIINPKYTKYKKLPKYISLEQ